MMTAQPLSYKTHILYNRKDNKNMANNKKNKKNNQKSGSTTPKKNEPKAKKSQYKNTEPKANIQSGKVDEASDCMSNYLDDYTKVRRMSLQLYAPPEQWGTALLEATHWAYIYHDKDTNDDGTPKTPHYHLLLIFENQRYRRAVRKLFDVPEEGENSTINFQKMGNCAQAYNYLRHFTAKCQEQGKHLYDPEEVYADDKNFWEEHSAPITTPNFDLLADLERLNHRQMALQYGKDYIKNFKRYDEFKATLEFEEDRRQQAENLTIGERIVREAREWNYEVNTAIATFIAFYVKSNLKFEVFKPDEAEYQVKADARHYIDSAICHIVERVEEMLWKEGADI